MKSSRGTFDGFSTSFLINTTTNSVPRLSACPSVKINGRRSVKRTRFLPMRGRKRKFVVAVGYNDVEGVECKRSASNHSSFISVNKH